MGTSKSYGGPGNNSPLLPPWADDSSPIPNPGESPNAPNPEDPAAPPANSIPAIPAGVPQSTNWSTTSRHFGSFVRGGGTGSLGKSLSSYTKSKGGARNASRSARAGRTSTAKLGGFLSNAARGGIRVATDALGLASTIIGMPVALALGAILDVIAPDGATPDDDAARYAINATLDEMYKQFELGEGDLTRLESIDAGTAKELIALSVTSYIYQKFLQDLEYSFEKGNIPEDEVIRLEREVKSYIQEKVKQELIQQDIDVLTINWSGAQGRQFCEDIYSQAYSLLEDRQ
jgi:hypothetical protein